MLSYVSNNKLVNVKNLSGWSRMFYTLHVPDFRLVSARSETIFVCAILFRAAQMCENTNACINTKCNTHHQVMTAHLCLAHNFLTRSSRFENSWSSGTKHTAQFHAFRQIDNAYSKNRTYQVTALGISII